MGGLGNQNSLLPSVELDYAFLSQEAKTGAWGSGISLSAGAQPEVATSNQAPKPLSLGLALSLLR